MALKFKSEFKLTVLGKWEIIARVDIFRLKWGCQQMAIVAVHSPASSPTYLKCQLESIANRPTIRPDKNFVAALS
jgi:hypothetical protein